MLKIGAKEEIEKTSNGRFSNGGILIPKKNRRNKTRFSDFSDFFSIHIEISVWATKIAEIYTI